VNGLPTGFHIQVLSGALQGAAFGFEQDRVVVGRADDCSLRFDPDSDLSVSSHHALLARGPDGWTVEDLSSTNGTYVNGIPSVGVNRLREGDVVEFGRGGPEVRISFARAPDVAASSSVGDPQESPSLGVGRVGAGWVTVALWGGVALAIVGIFWLGRTNQRAWDRERGQLMNRVDSLLATRASRDTERESALAELSDSLGLAREEVEQLREQLAAATSTNDRAQIEELQRRLQEAATLLERQQLAAALDFEGIRRQVEPAVAMIWSELADGTVLTGTAMSIDPDGTLLTNRHVVSPEGGGSGGRLAVQFAGSSQVWQATLIQVHRTADLAWARAEGIVGDVPHMDRFNDRADTMAVGSAVALVGFPLGGRPGAETAGSRRRAVVSAGVLLERRPNELRIQGYGAQGASGSPVVDRDGRVIGLIYGAESGSSILLAVPIAFAGQE
jgi:hypothetical protein